MPDEELDELQFAPPRVFPTAFAFAPTDVVGRPPPCFPHPPSPEVGKLDFALPPAPNPIFIYYICITFSPTF